MAGQLDRRDAGVVEYLAVRADGEIVCKGAIDYEEIPGAGEIMQLATRPELEGRADDTPTGWYSTVVLDLEKRL